MWGNRPHEESSAPNTKLPEEIFPLLLLNIFVHLCALSQSGSSFFFFRNKTADWLWGGTLDSWTHTHTQTLNTQPWCSLLKSNTWVVTSVFCRVSSHLPLAEKMLFCQPRKQLWNQLLNRKSVLSIRCTGVLQQKTKENKSAAWDCGSRSLHY